MAQRDVNKLVEILSKLNPLAKEFFPSSYTPDGRKSGSRLTPNAPVFVASSNNCSSANGRPSDNRPLNLRTRNGYNQGRRRMTERVTRAEREESIRRIVYVSDIDQNVTEEQLAELFTTCGQVVDCRACGDPHSILRFAFIEFADEYGARAAESLGGTMLGFYPVKVLPSRTAILPVNPKFLPRSIDEREMAVRTVYCTNIDKKVTQS